MKQFVVSILLLASPVTADDWPQWRGPDGNGVSRETDWKHEAVKGRPRIAWMRNVGAGHTSLVVAGDLLYTMGNMGGKDLVTCMEVGKGKPKWRYAYPCPPGGFPGPRATAVLDGKGNLFTLSHRGQAFCFDAANGRVKWQKDLVKELGAKNLDYGLTGSPLVVGDVVLYNACSRGIALDRETGKPVWVSDKTPGGYASPVRLDGDGKTAALFTHSSLVVVETATGKQTASTGWSTTFNVNAADPLLFDGKLFITSGWGRGCALLDVSGGGLRQVWSNRNLSGQFASPVHVEGHIYGVDGDEGRGRLRCLDAATGESKWAHGKGIENLSAAGDRLLVIDNTGTLTIVRADPAGYAELARATVLPKGRNWTAPVLANGRIYCRSGKGTLVCIDAR